MNFEFGMLALVPVLVSSAVLVGCGSDDSASTPTLTPFDSGTVVVPEAGVVPGPVTVQVQGQGNVESSDAHVVDGGTIAAVDCTQGSTARCSAPQHTFLYASAAPGWAFSMWTTTGAAAGIDLADGMNSIAVTDTTPSPIIAIFTPDGQTGPTGPITPADAGKSD